MRTLEQRTMRKVTRRIVPVIFLIYLISYIDRTNISFAALTMNRTIGLSPTQFGLGGAFFFAGYLFLQIPGALAVQRFGARRIITVMMLAWGLVGSGMALIWNVESFYVARALLGAAESAFFPGAILYISLWFPARHRGRIMTFFLLANPLSSVIGFPLSAVLMRLDGALGLAGWRWVFIGEGLPAVAFAAVAWLCLDDDPRTVTWLRADERAWLANDLASEAAHRSQVGQIGIGRALFSTPALAMAVGYFGIIMGLYGVNIWLPQFIRSYGFSIAQTGVIAAVPYAVATIAMLAAGLIASTRTSMPVRATISALVACLGLVVSTLDGPAFSSMIGLSAAPAGLFITLAAFWTIPTQMFTGPSRAAVIGLISSVGHVGGFVGPYLMGLFLDIFHDFRAGLITMAGGLLVTAAVAWCHRDVPAPA